MYIYIYLNTICAHTHTHAHYERLFFRVRGASGCGVRVFAFGRAGGFEERCWALGMSLTVPTARVSAPCKTGEKTVTLNLSQRFRVYRP